MDFERLRIRFETVYIRFRTLFKTIVRLVGLALIAVGFYNMFLVPMFQQQVFAPYPRLGLVISPWEGGYFIGDALIICIGAAIAWFT